jgi:hypothetical protein
VAGAGVAVWVSGVVLLLFGRLVAGFFSFLLFRVVPGKWERTGGAGKKANLVVVNACRGAWHGMAWHGILWRLCLYRVLSFLDVG